MVTNVINTIDALGVEELDHRAGRQHLQRFVQHVGARLHEHPGRSPPAAGVPFTLIFFQAFKQPQGKIKSVTFGKADNQTWLTSAGRVDGPLLFDVSFKNKLAYWGVVDPLQLPGADLSTTMSGADDRAGRPGGGLHDHR